MTAKLTKALCGFYADVSTIHKDSKGNFGKYADLATVLAAVNPALAKNGLAVLQTFEPCDDGSQLLCTHLLHESGESLVSRLPLIIAKGRNPLHDWGGATTYQRRYALLAMLNLAAGIEDDDGESATGAAPAKPAPRAQRDDRVHPVAKAQPASPAPTSPSSSVPAKEPPKNIVWIDPAVHARVSQALRDLDPERRTEVLDAFKKEFKIATPKIHPDQIQLPEHGAFLMQAMGLSDE